MSQYRAHVKVGRLVVAGVVFNTQPTLYELSSGEASNLRRLYGDRLVMDLMEDPDTEPAWAEGFTESDTRADTDPDIVLPGPSPEEPEPVADGLEDPPADPAVAELPPADPEPEPETVAENPPAEPEPVAAGPARRSRAKDPEAAQE